MQPVTRPAGREGPSHPNRLRTSSERQSSQMDTSTKGFNENRSPSTLPKAFENMLKTTTETGDIGMFSIKPPRVAQPLPSTRPAHDYYQASQKPRSFRPYRGSEVDDRKHLPSYARDAASEVISMYETASQKSYPRAFEDSDYRSSSMTQTYSTYSLSNNRSCSSLGVQGDGNGLLQRPRSPFAYPTRLKRPGFRPSSPALTDGGAIDYSRRTEIPKTFCENPHESSSSPSSLYAQKRKPLRSDAHRSTHSLLSQVRSSPPRTSSPFMRSGNETPTLDWQRRMDASSSNASPSRSTLSLASTVNLHQGVPAPAPSTTSTPGKIPPPSPLYYDYTEEFDPDEYIPRPALDPPPQFRIDKTIPEDRPLSADWHSKDYSHEETQVEANLIDGLKGSASQLSKLPQNLSKSITDTRDLCSIFALEEKVRGVAVPAPCANSASQTTGTTRSANTIRLSGLGLGARELNNHVEAAFGLSSSPSLALKNGAEGSQKTSDNRLSNSSSFNGSNLDSTRTSAYSLNTQLRQFPRPPENGAREIHGKDTPGVCITGSSSVTSNASGKTTTLPKKTTELQGPSTKEKELLETHRAVRNDVQMQVALPLGEDQKNMPAVNDNNSTAKVASSNAASSWREETTQVTENDHEHQLITSSSLRDGRIRREPVGQESKNVDAPIEKMTTDVENSVPDLRHRKLISTSDIPMLAPKPISPARQLRLKNSIPQLMKALPPLPPEPTARIVPRSLQPMVTEAELPCRFSPMLPEARFCTTSLPQTSPQAKQTSNLALLSSRPDVSVEKVCHADTITKAVPEVPNPPAPPSKLKLKNRKSTLRPNSPPESRPWNLEENYPWSSSGLNVTLPPLARVGVLNQPKRPKFRLKMHRMSNSTTSGTVRVNRDSADASLSSATYLRNPVDLFSPPSGIENMFRQISRHLHPRRASASNISVEGGPVPDIAGPRKVRTRAATVPSEEHSSTESKSYFLHDSIKSQEGDSLRKRLQNLRARIRDPYVSRPIHSYKDIAQRGQVEKVASPMRPRPFKSYPDLREKSASLPKRRRPQQHRTQRLRKRLSHWIKSARSAISTRVK